MAAEPTSAASTPPSEAQRRPAPELRRAADLDDTYLWLGPGGGAAWIEGSWYSTFGGAATVVRVREQAWLGALGVSVGGARWTERDGGRLWLDVLAGTRRSLPSMIGVSIGPLVELGELHHPQIGASGSIWLFAGVVPYLRIGVVDAAGGFLEAGLQLSLPAIRW